MTFVEAEPSRMEAMFHPGNIIISPKAAEAIARAGQKPSEFVDRHAGIDHGELCYGSKKDNVSALNAGKRIRSCYATAAGEKIWLITEGIDMDSKDADVTKRELTTILLPVEY